MVTPISAAIFRRVAAVSVGQSSTMRASSLGSSTVGAVEAGGESLPTMSAVVTEVVTVPSVAALSPHFSRLFDSCWGYLLSRRSIRFLQSRGRR